VWGNHLVRGDALTAAAWRTDVAWGDGGVLGASQDGEDDNIVWGTACGGADCANIVWGTGCGDTDCDNIVWGTSGDDEGDNIVWGTADDTEDVLWSAPAIDRPRRIVVIMDAPLT
jgi:hypothetical protein